MSGSEDHGQIYEVGKDSYSFYELKNRSRVNAVKQTAGASTKIIAAMSLVAGGICGLLKMSNEMKLEEKKSTMSQKDEYETIKNARVFLSIAVDDLSKLESQNPEDVNDKRQLLKKYEGISKRLAKISHNTISLTNNSALKLEVNATLAYTYDMIAMIASDIDEEPITEEKNMEDLDDVRRSANYNALLNHVSAYCLYNVMRTAEVQRQNYKDTIREVVRGFLTVRESDLADENALHSDSETPEGQFLGTESYHAMHCARLRTIEALEEGNLEEAKKQIEIAFQNLDKAIDEDPESTLIPKFNDLDQLSSRLQNGKQEYEQR